MQRMGLRMAAWLVSGAAACVFAEREIYVAAEAGTGGDGSRRRPYQSLVQARDAPDRRLVDPHGSSPFLLSVAWNEAPALLAPGGSARNLAISHSNSSKSIPLTRRSCCSMSRRPLPTGERLGSVPLNLSPRGRDGGVEPASRVRGDHGVPRGVAA